MNTFDPELHLDHKDRAHLVSIAATEGFAVLVRIMRSEVDKFVIAQINADPADEKKVMAAHRMAKAAAQFCQGLTNRINEEVLQYTQAPKPDDTPVDVTDGLIDLGEVAEELEQLPNFLGGE